jgi:hypothetical protein
MNIDALWNNKKSIKAATGLEKDEAEELLADFIELRKQKKNPNKSNGGRPESLSNVGIFLMFMFFYRHYLNFEVLALMFEVSSSTAQRLINESESNIREILAKKNFSHLLVQDQKKKSRKPFSSSQKYISMALNNLYADQ